MIKLEGYLLAEPLFENTPISILKGVRQADGAPVIVKILAIEFPSPLQLARIRHEYELVSSLNHPGIIKAHGLEKFQHSLAIVMEDFGGQPLRALAATAAFSLQDKLLIGRRIGAILGEVHRQGIVHKDVNPNNILINPQTGEIKLIDFGNAARMAHDNGQTNSPEHLEGTLAYIAPEQTGRMNRPVDYRSDYYSLGITLYELLLGRRPFEAQDGMELVHQHIAVMPPQLHLQDATIPVALARVIDKLMAKNAEQRYQSSAGLCGDLDECIAALAAGSLLEGFEPGRHELPERFSLPARLYGRDAQVQSLLDAYARACTGSPGFVLVRGYSGIGKSSLINEIHKPIAHSSGYFVSGKFDQFRRNIPYAALIQAFQSLLHQILTESDARIAHWRKRLLAAMDGNARVVMDVIPELEHILGPQAEVPPLAPHEAQNRFNFYLLSFVRAFAQAEHPLALFLDDLQWADQASLNLLELLGADEGCRHLLIIGAYRQMDLDSAHPLHLALARIRSAGLALQEIALEQLPPEVVQELVADTMCCTFERAQPLAALVSRKTGGNPFFINQLLKNLHDSGLLSFDPAARCWSWDIAQIDRVGITDNVVELMSGMIRKLPAATQRLLQMAACIGNQFTLQELAVVSEATPAALAEAFRAAQQAELVIPIGDEYKLLDSGVSASSDNSGITGIGAQTMPDCLVRFRFLHDRVQQAAYDLLSEAEKMQAHHRAGTLLLQSTPQDQVDDRLFDIVNHLNQGLPLVSDAALRLQLAELNLRAAGKAKQAIAYQPALQYLAVAQSLHTGLPQRSPQLRWRILFERAECEHLSGQNEAALHAYRQALEDAPDEAALSSVYEALIHFHTNTGNFQLAYQTGREALKRFGVSLPAGFAPPLFALDLAELKWRMRGKQVAELIDLPLCRDEKMCSAMRLIGALLKAAYQIRPELCVANAVKAVNLSLKHGTMEDNAVAYLVFGGIFLGGVLGRHQAGYEFGQLALAMNARFDQAKQRSEINFVAGYFTHFWLKPARDTEAYYRTAFDSGLQTGDFFHLSCAACTLLESQYIRGVALPELHKLGRDYLALMERIGSHEPADAIRSVLRAVQNLEGMTEGPASFGDHHFSEAELVGRLEKFSSKHFAHFYFVNKMQTLYLWRRPAEALEMARQSARYLKHSLAMLHTVEHHFYHALILCAAFEAKPNAAHLRRARKILAKFEQWARLNPANFEHKALLIRAEIQRLSKPGYEVADLYARAIRSADEHGYLQNKALGNELAGRFFASTSLVMSARGHLQEAYYGYQLWGASGIADRLLNDFPQFLGRRSTHGLSELPLPSDEDLPYSGALQSKGQLRSNASLSSAGSRRKASLDIETIIKATQAISGEIRLSTLLQKLMLIMLENAGAEKGCFIRVERGELTVEATGSVSAGVSILGGTPLNGADLPVSLVQYVARLGVSVVLHDAQADARFWDDAYVVQARPQSLLCVPVIHQGELIGVICLENSQTSGAFTAGRVELLGILAAQAGISIENSLLYANLEQRVQERTQELSLATEKLKAANEALEKLTLIDTLTQVSNKRHFQQVFEEEWKRALRNASTLTLMVIDIDCFKPYNDSYGHLEGDRCLKAVASALASVVNRASDLLARFGGEEFVILLADASPEEAQLIAARLLDAVRQLQIPHKSSVASDVVTISLGLAQAVPQQADGASQLFEAADQALYRAKTTGRDRYCL
ncbi:diguanylate cyclase domain-containing protein [Roseateles albus]|uniref:Diguanylate cyclase n=1 Tax=Roseateles albus TaxID=2987525 RepID=A0ABT5KEZ4_9BURK|nr:diguanylate cyclase [Roseateles albus]MDC8772492.1 diguanylate cyclase [Roseateles albus]